MNKRTALVVFGNEMPNVNYDRYDVVISGEKLKELIGPGSIYEASRLVEELSYLTLPSGSRLTKSFIYKGYELWWVNYNNLFLYFCLPYTQYQRLLEYLKDFQSVYFYQPLYKSLFSCYLNAYGCKVNIISKQDLESHIYFPFGILIQIIITFLSLPILAARKYSTMLFTGDKFELDRDYDFRMRFIYEELRQKELPFVEFIRSLESWKTILKHAYKRKRPVIYSEGVVFLARLFGTITGGRGRARLKFGPSVFASETNPDRRFKLLIATQYLLGVYDDVWAIRIMKWVLGAAGIKAAIVTVSTERNFHAVLGCKLNAISTVGILHGVASRYYNGYDFLPGFDGDKVLSVDKYGLWSEWWEEYYLKHSKAYRPEQLHVSGPMRPLERIDHKLNTPSPKRKGPIKVLFVGEQLGYFPEVLLYLSKLMESENIDLYLKFRVYRDGFEEWLKENEPKILSEVKVLKGSMQDALSICDVAVGSHSTGVLEALLQLKPAVFYDTKKWGDYFDLSGYDPEFRFFARNPEELIHCINKSMEIPISALNSIQERFFGNPYQNGSRWVVDEVEKYINS